MDIQKIRNRFYAERKYENFKKKNKELFLKHQVLENYQEAFDKIEDLIMDGDLFLGALVMANNELFEKESKYNCPGVFVYSKDRYYEENTNELEELASKLYDLRFADDEELIIDKDKKYIADLLNDEYTPTFNQLIPSSLTDGRTVFITSILIMRRELKDRFLQGKLHPLLIKDGVIGGRLLPAMYYDEEYRVYSEFDFRVANQFFLSAILIIISIIMYLFNKRTFSTIIIILLSIFTLFNYRCPKCSKLLIFKSKSKLCPKCGARLKK